MDLEKVATRFRQITTIALTIGLIIWFFSCKSAPRSGHNYYDSNNHKSKQWKNQKHLWEGKKYHRKAKSQ